MVDKPSDTDPPGSGRSPPQGASRLGGRRSLRSPSEALQPVSAPPPPKAPKRRRRPIVATLSGILSFVGIAAIALAIAGSLGVQRVNSAGPLPTDKVVTVRPGSDIQVVDQLAEEGVVENRYLTTAALWLEAGRGNVKSGEYMFKQAASVRDVIETIILGKQILHAITIPEGLTSEQVVDRLRENDVLLGDIVATPAEGTLMPDTYKFARGTTRDQVIRSMQSEQKRILSEVWVHRSPDTPIHSPFELVTLASIVEKETGRADERPRVAGVFVNRLVRNMPLQSDPTIVYGLVGGKGTLGRGILKSELEQKTPYNTYAITGLPPGPIANPGKAALEAVANPSRTKDLYFVADGTGGHAFADNLDQHRLNVLRWRQIEKDAKDRLNTDNDKGTPGAPAAPRPEQHGGLDVDRVAADDTAAPASLSSATGSPPIAASGASTVTSFAVNQFSAVTKTFASPAAAPGTTFDELDVEVAGVKSKSDPATWGDGDEAGVAMGADPGGRDPQGGDGTMQTFPVPAAHLAEQRAQAAALGLNTGSDRLPSDAPAAGPAPSSSIHLYGKGRIIDASEGTSFDPLRDKSYDLTTAKIVPAIKPLPPVQPLATSVN